MQQNNTNNADVFDKEGTRKMLKPLAIEGVRALCDAGAVSYVRLVASSDGLSVEINRAFVVANRHKRPRYFAKSDTCFSWVRELGINRVDEVDLTNWVV